MNKAVAARRKRVNKRTKRSRASGAGKRTAKRKKVNRSSTSRATSKSVPIAPASQDAYVEGYREGLYDGGERWIEAHLPGDRIVPDLTLEEVVAAGTQALLSRSLMLHGTEEVYSEIDKALMEGTPYSLIRLGDGELLTLCQDTVMPAEEVLKEGPFLAYAGITAPDTGARDILVSVISRATMVGIPLSRRPHFQPLLFPALRANHLELLSMRLTSSTVNYSLYDQGYLMHLFNGRKVLLIGNAADPLAYALSAAGVHVIGTINAVHGLPDHVRVVEEGARIEFDLALVSAGVAAVPICVLLAERTGKVALDFGHLADVLGGHKHTGAIQ